LVRTAQQGETTTIDPYCVSLLQQQLCQIGAILAGNPGDECDFAVFGQHFVFLKVVRRNLWNDDDQKWAPKVIYGMMMINDGLP
jgi:hypothetical protein